MKKPSRWELSEIERLLQKHAQREKELLDRFAETLGVKEPTPPEESLMNWYRTHDPRGMRAVRVKQRKEGRR